MLLNQIISPKSIINGLPILERIHLGDYNSLIAGIMVACFLYFIYLNKPEKIQKKNKEETWPYSVLLTRMLAILPFALLIVYYYFR